MDRSEVNLLFIIPKKECFCFCFTSKQIWHEQDSRKIMCFYEDKAPLIIVKSIAVRLRNNLQILEYQDGLKRLKPQPLWSNNTVLCFSLTTTAGSQTTLFSFEEHLQLPRDRLPWRPFWRHCQTLVTPLTSSPFHRFYTRNTQTR